MKNSTEPAIDTYQDIDAAKQTQRGWSKYLSIETATSAVANMLFSIFFCVLVFHGHARVPIRGSGGLIFDAIPQCFMVGWFGALISPLVTRKRIAAKSLPINLKNRLAHTYQIWVRAFFIAFISMVVGVAIQAVLLPVVFPPTLSFWQVFLYKCLCGAGISVVVTPCALLTAFKFEVSGIPARCS
jgi:hypothetical protein